MNDDTLDRLHGDMATADLAPTWKYVSEFVSRTPKVSYRPYLWKWDMVVHHLMRAGELITPERGAERRSMEHVNPDLTDKFSTTHTIASAFQLVKAGETAPAHRHQAGAIRFIISSKGGNVFSRVHGEPLMMETFDMLLTPSGSWHEHENNTGHDIVWLDVLDYPLVNLLQASWFEPGEGTPVAHRDPSFTPRRVGGVRPLAAAVPDSLAVRYAWADAKEALGEIGPGARSPYDDAIVEYFDPETGGSTLPTLSCRVQKLSPGFEGVARRSTSSKVYFVMEGEGSSIIAGQRFDWAKGDVFMVPTWAWHEHRNGNGESLLFSVTDEPVMRKLGMFREEALLTKHQEATAVFQPFRLLAAR